MYIKYFDYLSPKVTFYYKGLLSHSSIFSGLLSIISILFIIILAVQFALELFKKEEPNAFYYNSYIEDPGTININTSSLFHFINIIKIIRGDYYNEEFDFTTFNIFGIHVYLDNYLVLEREIGILSFDHWLYGYCNKDINTHGLDDLLTYNFLEKSACIKKYYNSTEKIYYDIGDPKFVWPSVAHGTLNEKKELYGIYIQKCNNKTIKNILGDEYECKSDLEIDNYFNIPGSRVIHLNFINNYINLLNYENPNTKFFYTIENPFIKDFYSSNEINLNPIVLRSHNGLILDNIKNDYSYMFDRNVIYASSNEGKNIYIAYMFFLKNILEYYERSYKKLPEIFSRIGGIYQVINIISFYINYLYYRFIVISDTELLLYSSVNIERKNHKKKVKDLRDSKKKMKDLKNKDKSNKEFSKITEQKHHIKEKKEKKEGKIKTNIYNKNESNISNINNNNSIEKLNKTDKNVNRKDTSNYYIDLNNIERIKSNVQKNNFWNFLLYKISCKNKKKSFKVYENFRQKILSEEHLIRNHLNIYNLLKVTEKKRTARRNSYQFRDLIKLV